jgi:hypothetical protein
MPTNAFDVTKDPNDEGSQFLTKEEKAEIKAGPKDAKVKDKKKK